MLAVETEKHFHNLDKRLSILKLLNKKGELDIRYLLFLILLVLFYLYLRSLGIVP